MLRQRRASARLRGVSGRLLVVEKVDRRPLRFPSVVCGESVAGRGVSAGGGNSQTEGNYPRVSLLRAHAKSGSPLARSSRNSASFADVDPPTPPIVSRGCCGDAAVPAVQPVRLCEHRAGPSPLSRIDRRDGDAVFLQRAEDSQAEMKAAVVGIAPAALWRSLPREPLFQRRDRVS